MAYGHRSDLSRRRGRRLLWRGAGMVGYMPASVPRLAGHRLQGDDGIDSTALWFLVRKVLEEKERRREEEKETAARSSASSAPKRTRKKTRKKRTRKTSSSRAVRTQKSGHSSTSSSWYVYSGDVMSSVACGSSFLLGLYWLLQHSAISGLDCAYSWSCRVKVATFIRTRWRTREVLPSMLAGFATLCCVSIDCLCPWRFHRCSSWTRWYARRCSVWCFWSDSADNCGHSPVAVLGQGRADFLSLIDVPVVQFVQLPRWWSRRANCGLPQLQFTDTLVTCPLLSTTGLGGAADAVLAVIDVAVNMQRHVVSRQSRCLRLSSSPEFGDISLRNRDRCAQLQLCMAGLVWPAWWRRRGRFESTHGKRFESTHGGHRQFCLPKFAHVGLPRASEVHKKKTFRSFPCSSLRKDREQHVPDSSNHSLFLIKLLSCSYPEETLEGTSREMVRFVFRSHEKKFHERFAR